MDGRTERMVCVWVYATDCYEHKQETEITGRVMVLVCFFAGFLLATLFCEKL